MTRGTGELEVWDRVLYIAVLIYQRLDGPLETFDGD